MVAAPKLPCPADWEWKKNNEGGVFAGLCYQRLQKLVMNSCTVDARKVAEAKANV